MLLGALAAGLVWALTGLLGGGAGAGAGRGSPVAGPAPAPASASASGQSTSSTPASAGVTGRVATPSPTRVATRPPAAPSPSASRPVLKGSFGGQVRPTRIRIPSIGVNAPIERLRLGPDRVLPPPKEWANAGWHRTGPVPGDRGPAVIAGHVDSTSGPAVFYRLRELDPGDRIEVVLDDGRTSRFRVVGATQFAKADFPTDEVYGPTPGRELRLITCGGSFDAAWGHYRDNVVVSAVVEEEAELALG